jgi:hypothetical protein
VFSFVELYGPAGIGKTALLCYLAHHVSPEAFPDGILCFPAHHLLLADLLQLLYDAFYKSAIPLKPTDAQIRQALRDKKALILLDDVDLARDQVKSLVDVAPDCVFCLASLEQRLWGEAQDIHVQGLPPEAAMQLIERELDRPLTPQERSAAQQLYAALEGHPLSLFQAAVSACKGEISLTELAQQAQIQSFSKVLTMHLLASLSQSEQRVLTVLAALDNARLSLASLSALTGLADVAPILAALQQRGLVQSRSLHYHLTGDLALILHENLDLTFWAERALTFFARWAEQSALTWERSLEEAESILQVLAWAIKSKCWVEALRLARAVESSLALSKQWGAWNQVLRWGLEAATALGDRPAEAWALHQIGTRALCLGESTVARESLVRALHLRESLGDHAGAHATRHNLNLLLPPAPPCPPQPPAFLALTPEFPLATQFLIVLVSIVLVLAGLGTVIVGPPLAALLAPTPIPTLTATWTPSITPRPTYTPTPTPTPSSTPTPTFTHTPTPTPTPTPRPPDLVITTFTVGKPTNGANNELVLPVSVVVKNQGEMAANVFQVTIYCSPVQSSLAPPVSASASHPAVSMQPGALPIVANLGVAQNTVLGQTHGGVASNIPDSFVPCIGLGARDPLTFTVPGQTTFSPSTTGPLSGENSVTFSGSVALSPLLEGTQIVLQAEADSCQNKATMPHCQVDESDENNNVSGMVVVALIRPTPTPTPSRTPRPDETDLSPRPTHTRTPTSTPGTPTVTPTRDTIGPSIQASVSSNQIWTNSRCGPDSVTISATVVDPSQVRVVILRYRVRLENNASEWQSASMPPVAKDFYQTTIVAHRLPSPYIGTLDYYVEAFDTFDNSAHTAEQKLEVRFCD